MVEQSRLGQAFGVFRQRIVERFNPEAGKVGERVSQGVLGDGNGDLEGAASVTCQCSRVASCKLHQQAGDG